MQGKWKRLQEFDFCPSLKSNRSKKYSSASYYLKANLFQRPSGRPTALYVVVTSYSDLGGGQTLLCMNKTDS